MLVLAKMLWLGEKRERELARIAHTIYACSQMCSHYSCIRINQAWYTMRQFVNFALRVHSFRCEFCRCSSGPLWLRVQVCRRTALHLECISQPHTTKPSHSGTYTNGVASKWIIACCIVPSSFPLNDFAQTLNGLFMLHTFCSCVLCLIWSM